MKQSDSLRAGSLHMQQSEQTTSGMHRLTPTATASRPCLPFNQVAVLRQPIEDTILNQPLETITQMTSQGVSVNRRRNIAMNLTSNSGDIGEKSKSQLVKVHNRHQAGLISKSQQGYRVVPVQQFGTTSSPRCLENIVKLKRESFSQGQARRRVTQICPLQPQTKETFHQFGYQGKFPQTAKPRRRLKTEYVPVTERSCFGGGHFSPLFTEQSTWQRRTGMSAETKNRFVLGKKNKQLAAFAKLMSVSSGLRKNILPRNHAEINQIYQKRLNKYLNLIAIHGENNPVVDQIFCNRELDHDDLALSGLQQKAIQDQINQYLHQIESLNHNMIEDRTEFGTRTQRRNIDYGKWDKAGGHVSIKPVEYKLTAVVPAQQHPGSTLLSIRSQNQNRMHPSSLGNQQSPTNSQELNSSQGRQILVKNQRVAETILHNYSTQRIIDSGSQCRTQFDQSQHQTKKQSQHLVVRSSINVENQMRFGQSSDPARQPQIELLKRQTSLVEVDRVGQVKDSTIQLADKELMRSQQSESLIKQTDVAIDSRNSLKRYEVHFPGSCGYPTQAYNKNEASITQPEHSQEATVSESHWPPTSDFQQIAIEEPQIIETRNLQGDCLRANEISQAATNQKVDHETDLRRLQPNASDGQLQPNASDRQLVPQEDSKEPTSNAHRPSTLCDYQLLEQYDNSSQARSQSKFRKSIDSGDPAKLKIISGECKPAADEGLRSLTSDGSPSGPPFLQIAKQNMKIFHQHLMEGRNCANQAQTDKKTSPKVKPLAITRQKQHGSNLQRPEYMGADDAHEQALIAQRKPLEEMGNLQDSMMNNAAVETFNPISPSKLVPVKVYPSHAGIPTVEQQNDTAFKIRKKSVNSQFKQPQFKSAQFYFPHKQVDRNRMFTPHNYKTLKHNNQLFIVSHKANQLMVSFDQPTQPPNVVYQQRQPVMINQASQPEYTVTEQSSGVGPWNAGFGQAVNTTQEPSFLEVKHQIQQILTKQETALASDRQTQLRFVDNSVAEQEPQVNSSKMTASGENRQKQAIQEQGLHDTIGETVLDANTHEQDELSKQLTEARASGTRGCSRNKVNKELQITSTIGSEITSIKPQAMPKFSEQSFTLEERRKKSAKATQGSPKQSEKANKNQQASLTKKMSLEALMPQEIQLEELSDEGAALGESYLNSSQAIAFNKKRSSGNNSKLRTVFTKNLDVPPLRKQKSSTMAQYSQGTPANRSGEINYDQLIDAVQRVNSNFDMRTSTEILKNTKQMTRLSAKRSLQPSAIQPGLNPVLNDRTQVPVVQMRQASKTPLGRALHYIGEAPTTNFPGADNRTTSTKVEQRQARPKSLQKYSIQRLHSSMILETPPLKQRKMGTTITVQTEIAQNQVAKLTHSESTEQRGHEPHTLSPCSDISLAIALEPTKVLLVQ